MGRRWTDQDIEQLKRMAQRYPAAKIAELTDRSMGAVAFKAHKLKLSLRSRREPESPIRRRRLVVEGSVAPPRLKLCDLPIAVP
jgi:hypothetical protein